MSDYRIFYVGTADEAAHHAAPLMDLLDLRLAEPDQVVAEARCGDLAIFWSEHFHRFRNAWYALHQAGCLTLYAVDGILEWRNAWGTGSEEPACPTTMRPVLSDKVACIGPSQARVLDAWGNTGKTEITGIPRLDEVGGQRATRSVLREQHEPRRILVTTAKWPAYTPEQYSLIRQSLIDLHRLSLSRSSPLSRHEWIWRLTGGLAAELDVNNQLTSTTTGELARLLNDVDAVITTPSTVLLESMLVGLPTALLDYTNSPAYVPAAWQISAREHMESIAGQLLDPTAERMALQEMLLADALQCEVPASNRMAELCEAMIRIAHDCRAEGRAVEFPRRILPALHAETDSALFFPHHTGNDSAGSDDRAAVSAVLEENRRQLGVLLRRVALLESELEKAANGFRKIASHPILGPLLKVRQTAIRFGNQIGHVLNREREPGAPADDASSSPTSTGSAE